MAAAPTGYLVNLTGWQPFFIGCALMAIPGLLILFKFSDWQLTPSPAV